MASFPPSGSVVPQPKLASTVGVPAQAPKEAPGHQPCLAAALDYARRGFSVIPIEPRGKKPLVQWKPYQERRASEDEIHAWWRQWPDANVGLVTGAISGLIVLDTDGTDGEHALNAAGITFDELRLAPCAGTGRGLHFYFRHPGGKLGNFAGRLTKVDGRADGGFVAAPPSVHSNGRKYAWLAGAGLDDRHLPPAPPAALTLFAKPQQTIAPAPLLSFNAPEKRVGRPGPDQTVEHYVSEAVARECDAVRAEPQGSRNNRLNAAGFSLGQLVAAGVLEQDHAERRLFEAARAAGLPEREARATIKSGLEAGTSKPRDLSQVGRVSYAKTAKTDESVNQQVLAVPSVGDWPELGDLPPVLPMAPPLSDDLVPPALRPWLMDIAERVQLPLEFVAGPAVVALAAVVGRRIGIHPKRHDDWMEVPNLWGMLVARPGSMKTPAIKEATRPLNRLVLEAREEYQTKRALFEERGPILELEIAGLRKRIAKLRAEAKSDEEKKAQCLLLEQELRLRRQEYNALRPSERRYLVNDPTVEKLGELLKANPNGLLLLRDELSGFLRTLDRPGKEGDREFYLESWNGTGSFTVDRIGRGTVHIPAACLSMLGGIQPSKLHQYTAETIGSGAGGDGLLQRFQIAIWPEHTGEWRNVDRWPDGEARGRAFGLFKTLAELDPLAIGASAEYEDVPAVRFTQQAQEFFDSWRADLERRLRSDDLKDTPAFEAHLSKYRKLIVALALLFHLARVADGSGEQAVSFDAALMAAGWCNVLEAHARKVYAAELAPAVNPAHALARKIRTGAIKDGDPIRDIYRAQWAGLRAPDAVHAGLRELERIGWLRIAQVATGGRPMEVVVLHPKLKRDDGGGH